MIRKIQGFFNSQTPLYETLLALFSLLFTKSIFIAPFSLVKGFWGIIIGIFLWIAVFLLCAATLYFIKKIKWEFKKTNVQKRRILLYMVPSLALSTFLLLVYFPGIMSWDSMYIWETATAGEYASLHPITYVLFVRLLSLTIASPWLVIAIQFIYSAFIFAYSGYVFETMGLNKKICWATVLAMSLYPINAMSNISMLKDVPYIMSLLLLSILALKIVTDNKLTIAMCAAVSAVSLVAMFSRHNGLLSLPLALLFMLVYFLKNKKFKQVLKMTVVLALVVVCFLGTNKGIITSLGNKFWQRSNSSDLIMMPSAQLSYTVDKNWGVLTDTQKPAAKKYLNTGYINYQKSVIGNWQFNNRYLETLNMDEILKDKQGFINFYLDILKSYPLDMIKEYEQITGIVWATPNYGYTLVRNYGIPEQYIDIGLKSQYVFPKIAKFIDSSPKIFFLLRPALWLMLSLLLLFAYPKKLGKSFLIISPMIANAAGYILATPAQNVRYLYCNFSCFIILLIFTFMTEGKKESISLPDTKTIQSK